MWNIYLTQIVVEEHINSDINRKGKGKRKALDDEVVIDLEDEYEGDNEVEGDSEVEIQGNNTRCEANVEDENDNEDEKYVANSEDVSEKSITSPIKFSYFVISLI